MNVNADVAASPLVTYFAEMDAGRFDHVLDTLAESCVYVRPLPGQRQAELAVFEGKAAISAFLNARGKLSVTHQILWATHQGRQSFLGGISSQVTPTGKEESLFIAHAIIDDNGLISRFLAMAASIEPGGTALSAIANGYPPRA